MAKGGIKMAINKQWGPKIFEEYYYIKPSGEVACEINEDLIWDREIINYGNCFKTKEEAKEKAIEIRELFKNR